jgi:hypothetical protein
MFLQRGTGGVLYAMASGGTKTRMTTMNIPYPIASVVEIDDIQYLVQEYSYRVGNGIENVLDCVEYSLIGFDSDSGMAWVWHDHLKYIGPATVETWRKLIDAVYEERKDEL